MVTRLFYSMLQSAMWTQQTLTQQTHSENEQLTMSLEEEGRWSNIESKDLDGGIDRCCSCRGGGGHLLPSLEDSSIPCRDPPSHGQLRHRSQSAPVCKVPRSGKKCFNRHITLLAYSACLFDELLFVRVDISSNVSSVEDSNYCLTSLWNVFI